MNQDIDIREKELTISSYSFNDIPYNQNNNFYSYSKWSLEYENEYFESEFKKVFNDHDTFGQLIQEEEKEEEKKKIESLSKIKPKKFRCMYKTKKYVNKKPKLKPKNILSIFKKNNYKKFSFDDIIILLKQLNKESNSNIPILDKFNLLKIESRLISELKNRIIYKIQNDS